MNKNALNYIISFGIGAVILISVCLLEGAFGSSEGKDIAASVCDGAFVAAVLLLGAGLLALVGGKGAFDGISYSVRQSLRLHWPAAVRTPEEDYEAYQKRREGKKVKTAHLFLSGGFYLAIALLALLVYYV